jgi:enediyne biosynthesis protein E4
LPRSPTCYNATRERQVCGWSHEAGLDAAPAYHGLGVVAADLDQDGDIDLYVANDADPNQLWENRGQGGFVERGAVSGVAANRHGERDAGMGIALGDFRGGGAFDLFVANFHYETNTFYRNEPFAQPSSHFRQ